MNVDEMITELAAAFGAETLVILGTVAFAALLVGVFLIKPGD